MSIKGRPEFQRMLQDVSEEKAKTIRIMIIMCGVTEKKVFTQMI